MGTWTKAFLNDKNQHERKIKINQAKIKGKQKKRNRKKRVKSIRKFVLDRV